MRLNLTTGAILGLIALLWIGPSWAEPEEPTEVSEEQNEAAVDDNWVLHETPYDFPNVPVPRVLWDHILNRLKEEGANEKLLQEFVIAPVAIQVDMSSEIDQILKDRKNHRVVFKEGGGPIDFFDFVVGKGKFYLKMIPNLNHEKKIHVFYISDSPERVKNGERFGNGCGKIFDISTKSSIFMDRDGIQLTSSHKHYLHLLAGTFIFFQLIEDKLYLGYTQLLDSRYPQFDCRDQ